MTADRVVPDDDREEPPVIGGRPSRLELIAECRRRIREATERHEKGDETGG